MADGLRPVIPDAHGHGFDTQDWLLYNRVGATLANSGHPDEALQYYYSALELNPTYIRARYVSGLRTYRLAS